MVGMNPELKGTIVPGLGNPNNPAYPIDGESAKFTKKAKSTTRVLVAFKIGLFLLNNCIFAFLLKILVSVRSDAIKERAAPKGDPFAYAQGCF